MKEKYLIVIPRVIFDKPLNELSPSLFLLFLICYIFQKEV